VQRETISRAGKLVMVFSKRCWSLLGRGTPGSVPEGVLDRVLDRVLAPKTSPQKLKSPPLALPPTGGGNALHAASCDRTSEWMWRGSSWIGSVESVVLVGWCRCGMSQWLAGMLSAVCPHCRSTGWDACLTSSGKVRAAWHIARVRVGLRGAARD
jgi:hypothetical protein